MRILTIPLTAAYVVLFLPSILLGSLALALAIGIGKVAGAARRRSDEAPVAPAR